MENSAELLNEFQKNSLSVSLRLLEKRILLLESLLELGEKEGALYSFRIDLNEAEIERFREKVEFIRQLVGIIREKFKLKPSEDYFSQHLKGLSSYFLTVFEDEKAAKLRRYGKVSPDLPAELDPLIEELLGHIRSLLAGVEG